MEEKEKEELMGKMMSEFNSELEKSGGIVNGVKYRHDMDMEIQIRIDYLTDAFGKDLVDEEMSKYKNSDGGFIDAISDERVWNTIISNLKSKNI